jgi:hypothetical protein
MEEWNPAGKSQNDAGPHLGLSRADMDLAERRLATVVMAAVIDSSYLLTFLAQ